MKTNDKKQAIEKFEVYAQGVKRLKELEKELDYLDTSKYPSEEKKIRKKLKDVSAIPEIEEDLRKLKLKIAGVSVDHLKTRTDNLQQNEIENLKNEEQQLKSKIPDLYHKIKILEDKIKILEKSPSKKTFSNIPKLRKKIALLKNILNIRNNQISEILEKNNSDILPKVEKKAGLISRLFNRNSKKINELSYKIDENRLDINKKLLLEIADSKRMIEDQRFEIKKQLIDALAETINQLHKEKEESDRKILQQIESLNKKIQYEKKEINNDLVDKIVQLKSKIDNSKYQLKKDIEREIQILKSRIENPELSKHLLAQIPPAPSAAPLVSNNEKVFESISEKSSIKFNEIKEEKKLEKNKSLNEKISFYNSDYAHLPEFPILKEDFNLFPINISSREIPRITVPISQISNADEPIENEKKTALGGWKLKNVQIEPSKEITKPLKNVKRKIPKKKFMQSYIFDSILSDIKNVKIMVIECKQEIYEELESKHKGDIAFAKSFEAIESLKENFAKMKNCFNLKE